MKRAISVVFILLSTSVARGELICDARELVMGGNGRTGSVTVGESPFSFSWADDQTGLFNEEQFCGLEMGQDMSCETIDNSFGQTESYSFDCVDRSLPAGADHFGKGRFVISHINNVGRFHCEGSGVRKTVEFNNCRASDSITASELNVLGGAAIFVLPLRVPTVIQ